MITVGFVSTYDPDDVSAWSGIGANMRGSLEREDDLRVHGIGPLRRARTARVIAGQIANRLRRRHAFHADRDIAISRAYALQAAQRLEQVGADVAVSPGTIPVAFLDFSGPIVVWTDATFANLVGFYPEFTGLDGRTIRDGHRLEREALARCAAAIYTSSWAARSAVEHYGAEPSKVHVIPFGANVDAPPEAEVRAAVRARLRAMGPKRVLFVGGDWARKGGDTAIEAVREARRLGADVELTVVGGRPRRSSLPGFVDVLGFADKRTEGGRRRLSQAFQHGYISILPSIADCTPVALTEGYAFGVPALAADVGGMDAVVQAGETGLLLPSSATAADYGEALAGMVRDEPRYARMASAALAASQQRFNWLAAAAEAATVIRGVVDP